MHSEAQMALEAELSERGNVWKMSPKFMVIGHRGSGMNKVLCLDERMQTIRENTIMSFNAAAKSGVELVEFDVQVTRDRHAVLFHDDLIITKVNGKIAEKRIDELTLEEFLESGYQKDGCKVGKSLMRRTEDGQTAEWEVALDDCLCALKDVFENVDLSVGFNIELKFIDEIQYQKEHLKEALQVILKDVYENAKGRRIFFSSFHPEAAQLIRKMQTVYPVFFLTKGGTQTFKDCRRNSLQAAIQVCIEGELQGIVSEVKAVLQNPDAIINIKGHNFRLLTYGQLNNSADVVYIQHLIGIDGVITDLVREIMATVAEFADKSNSKDGELLWRDAPQRQVLNCCAQLTCKEMSSILKLISWLIQN